MRRWPCSIPATRPAVEPFYDLYPPAAQFAGGTVKVVTLHPPRWELDPAEPAAALGPRTKLVILNPPQNPTGRSGAPRSRTSSPQALPEHGAYVSPTRSTARPPSAAPATSSSPPARACATAPSPSTARQDLQRDRLEIAGGGRPPLTAAIRGIHQFVDLLDLHPAPAGRRRGPRAGRRHRLLRPAAGGRRRPPPSASHAILDGAGLKTLPVEAGVLPARDIADLGFPDDVRPSAATSRPRRRSPPSRPRLLRRPEKARALARFWFANSDATIAAAGERLKRLAPPA